MKLQKILRVAWEGLTLNKVRSLMTTLGVIIGVASVIVVLAVSAGADAAIAEQINALGSVLFWIALFFPRAQSGLHVGAFLFWFAALLPMLFQLYQQARSGTEPMERAARRIVRGDTMQID